jgi:thiamine pyrophosphate-dependent acetolactate synthase large subunit-like protein
MTQRVDRRRFVAELLSAIGNALVVTGLGSPTYDVAAAGPRPGTFSLWGAMGGAVPLGLGLALAQPERSVVVVTGDGEMLMGVGALATVGAVQPRNLTVVVLDNGHYGETGMQPSHTGLGTDLVAVARGFGIAGSLPATDLADAAAVAERVRARSAPTFVRVLVTAEEHPRVLPPRDGAANAVAFRGALGFGTF